MFVTRGPTCLHPYRLGRCLAHLTGVINPTKYPVKSKLDLTFCASVSSSVSTPTVVPAPRLWENQSVPSTKAEYLQKLLIQQPETPEGARVLKVAVVGCPNAGKSSLVNMLIKWRVCAVAGKAHTTRSKQMAALMQDNVQVVFVDLPGIVSGSKAKKFNLEKSFIRDPHAAIFDSDLVLVVVDVTHKRSREELDPEIVKALNFFPEKESVLVLNKVDKAQNDPTRLLEVTRKLTQGIVHNRRSHKDVYEARFLRRAQLPPTVPRLQPPSEIVARYLPEVCHVQANALLAHDAQLRAKLNAPSNPDSQVQLVSSGSNSAANTVLIPEGNSVSTPDVQQISSSLTVRPPTGSEREVTEAELASIDDYFKDYKRDVYEDSEIATAPEEDSKTLAVGGDIPEQCTESTTQLAERDSSIYFDSLLKTLEEQLMLKTASSEEVALRRKRWLEISIATKGVTSWTGFNEVFMVSSATGHGVDKLRDYLISRAIPGRRWMLSPLLVTDSEPSELVRMCVWAHCLEKLRQEVPYSLRIVVDDCEKARFMDDGDDRVFVHARIQCRSERHLRQVLGPAGSTIKEIAGSVKLELMTMFRANTVVKLTAEMISVKPHTMRQLHKAKDFAEVFPEFDRAHQ
ncbi:unnamed protein product [Calicophoron daubneyi]|uniref:GTPase Era, mitochondrial n=1 Tax=Calicophoron daubneyi TaxID=300641 RepID=A0AAV2TF39_CALDB